METVRAQKCVQFVTRMFEAALTEHFGSFDTFLISSSLLDIPKCKRGISKQNPRRYSVAAD